MKKLFFILIGSALLAACNKNKCEYDECAVAAPASEIQAVQAYLSANSIVATQHCSGIFYAVDQQGNGDRPGACDNVTVYYEGKLINGTVFDKTTTTPASFGLDGLITGFRNGLLQIKTGGKVRIYIPPSLGYGSRATGSIPANSILIFTVDLVAAE